jgi:hypothetical protein
MPIELLGRIPAPDGLLDAHRQGDQVEVVVDGAPKLLERLIASGFQATSSSMTLDDIFEAFVIGRPQAWNEANGAA